MSIVCEVISINNHKYYQLFLFMFIGIILKGTLFFSTVFSMTVTAEQMKDTPMPQKNFDMTPFYWAIGIVGGCIAITLAYVSWKKYRAEEKKEARKDTTVD